MRVHLAAAAVLFACEAPADPVEDAAPPADATAVPTFQTLYRDVIAPRCSGPSCHGDGAVLSFAKETSVIGAPARSAECSGFGDIVVPFDPESSLLYTKVTAAPCGSMMPLSLEPMPVNEIEAIRTWIERGAP